VGRTGFSKEAEGEMVREEVRAEFKDNDLGGSEVNLGKTTESSLEMPSLGFEGVGVDVEELGVGVEVLEDGETLFEVVELIIEEEEEKIRI